MVEYSRPRSNNLGVRGWFWGGNYKLERYLYIVHRVTGLGLLLFFSLHLVETTFFRIRGESVWEMTMRLLHNPVFEAGLVLVSMAFVIHALNGLRLIIQELGFLLGKPGRPVYPFKDSLRTHRAYTLAALGLILIMIIGFFVNSFMGGQG